MAMDKDALGTAIANRVKTLRPAQGTAITDGDLESVWQAVSDEIIKHLIANLDIVLASADINVSPGTFLDSLVQPITGKGITDAVTLSNKVQ